MSSIKYRLEKLLPSLVAEARKTKDPEIKARFYLIKAVVRSKKSVKKVCESRGESRENFYFWARRLLKGKALSCLSSSSRKPKKSPNQTPKRVEKRIIKLRALEPYNGPEVISEDLKRIFNIKCPPSTVYQVLKRNKLIKEEYSQRLTKKHLKRYRRPLPGYLQMDFKYVPFKINGSQFYQLSCVDHHSSWRLIRCYRYKNQCSVEQFLKELELLCPFPIYQLQTDNDTAFTDKYRVNTDGKPTGEHFVDKWCEELNVEHKLIPIGQKELNGKVENTHKQDDRIFFSQIVPNNFEEIRTATIGYNYRWNRLRRTKSLRWQTPEESVERAYVSVLAWFTTLKEKHKKEGYVEVGITKEGDYILKVKPPKLKKKMKKKIKKKSAVDRYLEWLEWDSKKYHNAMLPLSGMSLNFSCIFNHNLCEDLI